MEVKKVQKINERGIAILKEREAIHDGDLSVIGLQPKMDCSDIWTEGWGHAIVNPLTKKHIKGIENKELAYKYRIIKDDGIDDYKQADELLEVDLLKFETPLNELNLGLNDNQFSALVDFVYNVGFGNFEDSTLLKIINGSIRGHEMIDVETLKNDKAYKYLKDDGIEFITTFKWNFLRWCKSAGKEQKGLYIRRKLEYELYTLKNEN